MSFSLMTPQLFLRWRYPYTSGLHDFRNTGCDEKLNMVTRPSLNWLHLPKLTNSTSAGLVMELASSDSPLSAFECLDWRMKRKNSDSFMSALKAVWRLPFGLAFLERALNFVNDNTPTQWIIRESCLWLSVIFTNSPPPPRQQRPPWSLIFCKYVPRMCGILRPGGCPRTSAFRGSPKELWHCSEMVNVFRLLRQWIQCCGGSVYKSRRAFLTLDYGSFLQLGMLADV